MAQEPHALLSHRSDRWGILAVVLASVCLGIASIFGKQAYRAGVDPLTMLAVRFVLAALVAWSGYLVLGRRYIVASRSTLIGCILVGCANIVSTYFFFTGLARLDAALASLVFYTYPITVILILVALGERPSPQTALRLALTLAGLVLLATASGRFAPDRGGLAMVLGAGVAYAVHLVLGRRILQARGVQSPTIVLWVLTTLGVGLALLRLADGTPLPVITPAGWLPIVGQALVSTILARLLLFAGLGRVGSAQASLIGTAEPVFAVAAAYLVLDERLSWTQLVGGALVLANVMIGSLTGANGGNNKGHLH
jgi:drug/metabolite transporter (DMT)-like permease